DWVTLAESPGLATRTEMLMLQPVHGVTDATWIGGGASSGQSQFQLMISVVVSGPRSDRFIGAGASLQFQLQFQTMVFGEDGAGSAVIPLELSGVVLRLFCAGAGGGAGADAAGVGSAAGLAAAGTLPGVDGAEAGEAAGCAAAEAGGTAGDIGAG